MAMTAKLAQIKANRKWKRANPEKVRDQMRRWRKKQTEKDPNRLRVYNRIKQRERRAKLKEESSSQEDCTVGQSE